MTLATRCAACGTVFRVVQDQLKVSEGWVRCGHCNEVFDATADLFDPEAAAAPQSATPADAASSPGPEEHETDAADVAALNTADPAADAGETAAEAGLTPSPEGNSADRIDPAADASEATTADSAPGFVLQAERAAERAARWRQPKVQRFLRVVLAMLAAAALLQVLTGLRHSIIVRWPQATPLFQSWCALAGCELGSPRQIEGLAVDSSGLTRVEGASLFRLTVVLKNRGTRPLMLPALDVTLTDAQGSVIVRKVLAAAQLGAERPDIDAGEELPLQALLDTGLQRIDGYSIALFYP